jgi:hypothetical protein
LGKSKIAVFIDVENLTQWVKDDGTERLMADISAIGQVIVRRAYGVWSKPGISNFQAPLNRLGFELIHSFHPVSGKNSADIQLTVDVMEHALRLTDVDWFVLATGDSDFSPLFRRLREMGKEVIGVGPRSPLSESVKSSCSRYIHTDPVSTNTRELEFDDAAEIVESILAASTEPLALTVLKQGILNVNSAFSEKDMGFGSFSTFLKAIDTVALKMSPGSNTLWLAELVTPDNPRQSSAGLKPGSREHYQTLLRKKKWVTVPRELLGLVGETLGDLPPLEKQDMIEELIVRIASVRKDVTAADIRKAITLLYKAQMFELIDDTQHDSRLLKLKTDHDHMKEVDMAFIRRLRSACTENNVAFEPSIIRNLLFTQPSMPDLCTIIQTAEAEAVV